MPLLRKIFKKNLSGPGRISLSLPVAAALGVLLLCVTGWAFFMGLMVGKGQNPQAQIEVMTGGIIKPGPANNNDAVNESPPVPLDNESPLQAEAPEPQASAESAPTPAPAPAQPFTRPKGQELGAWGAAEPAPAATPPAKAVKSAPEKPQKPDKNAPTFNYTLQVAVFKSVKEGENLRASLKKLGIASRLQKSGKAQLVLVNLKGAEADLAQLRKQLAKLKLGKPLILSKKSLDKQEKKKGRKS